jgi:hypothetical protein
LEILVDLTITHLRSKLVYSNQFWSFRIAKWWVYRVRWQITLQFTGYYARLAANAFVLVNQNSPWFHSSSTREILQSNALNVAEPIAGS